MPKNLHSSPFQINREIPWEDLGKGMQRQLFGYNETIMMVKVKFEKGAIGEAHSHPHTQVSYVESGAFEMTIGDEKKVIKAGDGFYVHPGILHGTVCLEPGVLVDVFTPQREDFLPKMN
ncbi:cupin domain-containing protein [Segetibacter aerophilus]|nr:cupin domain-containing protein [Segetibacter aerophilus]